jgi:putative Holliday junction resolvase
MAIDFGQARTGVAVSDETLTLVGDAWVLQKKSLREVTQAVIYEAEKRGVSKIVVGHPKNMDGSIGPRAEKSEQLKNLLRSLCDIEIVLWDERLTTVSAHRILSDTGNFGKKRKSKVDAVAASLILEDYLTFLRST